MVYVRVYGIWIMESMVYLVGYLGDIVHMVESYLVG
jgi:hypothetical protein